MDRQGMTFVLPAVVAVVMYVAPGERSWADAPPASVASGSAERPAGAIVFEMKYRGLSQSDDPLSYRAYYGFASAPGGEKDPFVQAVKSQAKECTLLYNWTLPQAKWWVIELRDKKPVALYCRPQWRRQAFG